MDQQTEKPIIMLVDKEQMLLDVYKNIIGDNYDFIFQYDGSQALDTIKTRKETGQKDISLLLTGGRMNLMPGWELIRETKKIPGYESLPSILCTISMSEEEAKQQGADYVFKKQYHSLNNKLKETIDGILSK